MARFTIIAQTVFLLCCNQASASDIDFRIDMNRLVQGSLFNAEYDNLAASEERMRINNETSPNGELSLGEFFNVFDSTMFMTYHTYQPAGSFSERHLRKWINAHPDSVPAQIALAIYHKNHSVQLKRKFGENPLPNPELDPSTIQLKASQKVLDDLERKGVSHPHIEVVRLQILILKHVAEFELLQAHGAALKKFPSYFPIHYVVLDEIVKRARAKGLTPSMRLLVSSYTMQVLDQVGGVAGLEAYARLYLRIYRKHLKLQTLTVEGIDLRALQSGLGEIVAEYGTDENKNLAALMSCWTGDKSAAKLYWPKTIDERVNKIWKQPIYFQACETWMKNP